MTAVEQKNIEEQTDSAATQEPPPQKGRADDDSETLRHLDRFVTRVRNSEWAGHFDDAQGATGG